MRGHLDTRTCDYRRLFELHLNLHCRQWSLDHILHGVDRDLHHNLISACALFDQKMLWSCHGVVAQWCTCSTDCRLLKFRQHKCDWRICQNKDSFVWVLNFVRYFSWFYFMVTVGVGSWRRQKLTSGEGRSLHSGPVTWSNHQSHCCVLGLNSLLPNRLYIILAFLPIWVSTSRCIFTFMSTLSVGWKDNYMIENSYFIHMNWLPSSRLSTRLKAKGEEILKNQSKPGILRLYFWHPRSLLGLHLVKIWFSISQLVSLKNWEQWKLSAVQR